MSEMITPRAQAAGTQSTVAHSNSASASLPWDKLESCIAALERDWTGGQPRPLVAYLPPGGSALRNVALAELVKVDLELQWTAGRRPSLRDYCDWYSELGGESALPADLVYEAWHLARQYGVCQNVEEFCQDFPKQGPFVRRMAHLEALSSTVVTTQSAHIEGVAGARLGDFQLIELLGEGSFSKVFLARQLSLGREVALKVSAAATREAAAWPAWSTIISCEFSPNRSTSKLISTCSACNALPVRRWRRSFAGATTNRARPGRAGCS